MSRLSYRGERTPAWSTSPLSSSEEFRLAAPEGFSTSFGAPALTVPGSLGAYPCLLVSIIAFDVEDYQMTYWGVNVLCLGIKISPGQRPSRNNPKMAT